MSLAEITVAGRRLLADRSGALLWPEQHLLVIADLHFEKGSAFARRGQLLPPYDTRSTLDALEAVLARLRPRRVVSLGDGFHDVPGSARLGPLEAARLRRLVRGHDWVWVLGNHDPAPPAALGGRGEEAVEIGGLTLRHAPARAPAEGEVAGHLHPVARLHRRGRSVSRACFVGDPARIVLPAFGSYTGGLDVRDGAISGLFGSAPAVWLLGRRAVHRLPVARLEA